jgi:PilZ domain
MSVHSEMISTVPGRPILLAATGDLRRHRRLPLRIGGRFMRADRTEHACTTADMSVGGARLLSDAAVEPGERIVVYFDHLGGLEAIVARQSATGFAIHFRVSEHKREKLAAQIMWLANRDSYPDELGRTHERVGAGGRRTTLQLDEGVVIDVELLDLSASGASLGTSARPALGEDVFVGKVRAVVRRHHDKGIGLQFLTVQSQDALRSHFP